MASEANGRRSRPEIETAVRRASRAMGRLLDADPQAPQVLDDLDFRAPPPAGDRSELKGWQQREMLRIAARDLAGIDPLELVTSKLSALASDVVQVAVDLARPSEPVAVIGMGKLGAGELNYSSDIDVMVVGGDPTTARRILDVARDNFRVDAALRPEGRDGPLTRSLGSYEAYWKRWASHWEFQALLKARSVAGDPALGAAFDAAVIEHLWSRQFGADSLRELRNLKARAEELVERQDLTRREIKRGRGGIRDIEFAIQLLQLVHGGQDPTLRSPATLDALGALAEGGYVDPPDALALAEAYRFLREVEHRLQLVDLQQVHELPEGPEAMGHLAEGLGYRPEGPGTAPEKTSATQRFEGDLAKHRAAARAIHERLYFRPLLESFAGRAPLDSAAVEARLAAFGFSEVERTRKAIEELSGGLSRRSRLMEQMLPLLLDWLSSSPDPDLGLLGLRAIASRGHGARQLTEVFRESPEAARRLSLLLGTSPLMRAGFDRQPQLLADLAADPPLRGAGRESLAGRAGAGWRESGAEQVRALRHLRDEEVARLAARDILNLDEVADVARGLTTLAEVLLQAALDSLASAVPFAVIGMGRLGGLEMGYASDLDVMFVHGGTGPSDAAEAERVATELTRLINGATPAERIFELDSRLRPEGNQGPLARSLDGFRTYWEKWAQPWERQALLRARPVAGDVETGQSFMIEAQKFVGAPISNEEVRDLRRIKARVEGERIPAGEDPAFHLKLGPGALADVEWTAQLLQLQNGIAATSTLTALEALERQGALGIEDHEVLARSFRFCEHVRNRLFLVSGGRSDSLPTDPHRLGVLSRSLGKAPADLRDEYRRMTRRAREVVVRLFYGAPTPDP